MKNTLKIMSFNTQHCLNYIKKEIDFDAMANAIKQCGADIVGLQEMRDKGASADYENQVGILSRLTGMEYCYFAKAIDVGGVDPYGNGILSRVPIADVKTVMIPDPEDKSRGKHYETRCILKARLENGLTVLVTHFGLNPDEQENAVKCVLENLEDEKCVLMGDFNVRPDNEVLLPIRNRMKDTADMFDGQKLSFPSDVPNMKIDYIFVSEDIRVLSADIPSVVASDHRPHTAEIAI